MRDHTLAVINLSLILLDTLAQGYRASVKTKLKVCQVKRRLTSLKNVPTYFKKSSSESNVFLWAESAMT